MAYTFVAGPYTATYAGVNLGTTSEGYTINITYLTKDINVDEQGLGIADQLQAGQDVTVTLNFVEYQLAEPALMAQQAGVAGQGDIISEVGKLLSSQAGILILTPTVRTNNNETYTFPKAIVIDDVPILLSSGLREGPITFQCLPDNTSDGKHYTKS